MNVAESSRTRRGTRRVVLVLWAGAVLVLIASPMMLTEPVMLAYLLDPNCSR